MDYITFLEKTFMFHGTTKEQLNEIIEQYPPIIEEYSRTEVIGHQDEGLKRVGFIIEGKCNVVRSKCDGGKTVLNTLGKFDSFGILSVLSDEEYSTEIYVVKNSKILYFSKSQTIDIVNNYSHIAFNLIYFLSNRITFLNKKIETFSGTRVENRLASYILNLTSNDSNEISLNMKKCSEAINAGRASVYRALDSLLNANLIKLVDKKIYIIDRKGLERINQ